MLQKPSPSNTEIIYLWKEKFFGHLITYLLVLANNKNSSKTNLSLKNKVHLHGDMDYYSSSTSTKQIIPKIQENIYH